jgi:leucyl aminopeptidase
VKISTNQADFSKIKVSSLIKFCTEGAFTGDSLLRELNRASKGLIKKIYATGEFEGKLNQTIVLHNIPSINAERIILAGVGGEDKFNNDSFRQAAGTVSVLPAVKKSGTLGFYIESSSDEDCVASIIEGYLLGRFKIEDYKSDTEKSPTRSVQFVVASKSSVGPVRRGLKKGRINAEGVITARRLAFDPGNILTPRKFAAVAKNLSKKYKLKCRVLDEKKIMAERMGALLGVAQGSSEPPRFLILEYRGGGASRPMVLVGKGITFDSGGISLKPVLNMHEMKGDMQGGAIVLATMVCIARLKLPLNVVALIPLAENMPSARALKPGDIIRSRRGKTIEIINTDAEGRLILADALNYADRFKPQAVIDIATLTGAALFVLGYTAAPIMGNNKRLMDALRAASETTAEKVWELPIWDEYRRLMKSPIADLKNSGGKPAATITAGAFLENFIGDWPWAHIDIAYVDLEKDGAPYTPKGASGFGLRLLVRLLSDWKEIK